MSKKPAETTEFSRFMREAKTGEKKQVYKRVLERATERQKEVLASKQ
jgi:hypothetical protein